MECPICRNKTRVELDTHSDGFAENLQECGDCGAMWISKENESVLVHGSTLALAVNH